MAEFAVYRISKIKIEEIVFREQTRPFKILRIHATGECRDNREQDTHEINLFTYDMSLMPEVDCDHVIDLRLKKEEPNGVVPGTPESSEGSPGEGERTGELKDPDGIVTSVCAGRKLEERINAS